MFAKNLDLAPASCTVSIFSLTELKNDDFTDKLGRFCIRFATNAHRHSFYDAGAKTKFFANRIRNVILDFRFRSGIMQWVFVCGWRGWRVRRMQRARRGPMGDKSRRPSWWSGLIRIYCDISRRPSWWSRLIRINPDLWLFFCFFLTADLS